MRILYSRKEVFFSPAHNRRLYLIGNTQETTDVVSSEHIANLQKRVSQTLEPVKNTNMYLGGGFAIAYTLSRYPSEVVQNLLPKNVRVSIGGYYRDHAAIDLLCFEENLREVVQAFESKGKYLVGRLKMGPFSPMFKVSKGTKVEGYEPLTTEEALTRKNLRITDGTGEYLNLYLHHFETAARERVQKKEDETFTSLEGRRKIDPSLLEVVSNEDNVRVKITDFEGCRARISPGFLIKIAHPFYLLKAKARALHEKNKADPRHELDITILENLLVYIEHETPLSDLSPRME